MGLTEVIPGTRLLHYRIEGPLGRGGMGEVYAAEDTRLRRVVALKLLPTELAQDPLRLQRFRREAQALAALNHPSIVTLYAIEETEGRHFLTMELVRSKTLAEAIPTGGLKLPELFEIAVPLCDGIGAAHQRGVVHRDLKPANVMLSVEGRLKILDFGLAKVRQPVGTSEALSATSTDLTADRVLGTASYMSPEQAQGLPVDARSDVFSLGIVLYELATGVRPFRGDSSMSVLSAILKDEPQPPVALNPAVPPELDGLIRRCLAKEPARRYATAGEVHDQLDELRRRTAGLAPASAEPVDGLRDKLRRAVGWRPPEPSALVRTQPMLPEPRRRHALALGATLLALGLVTLLARGPEAFRSWLATRGAGGSQPVRSLAVLPLQNLSGSTEQEFLADGITEALTTELSKIAALDVISRTSAMRYKSAKKPVPEIARELHVDAVVEGSVQRVGERLRVTAQLIHGASDHHLWAASYDRDLTDVLALQSDLARAIATRVQVKLTPTEEKRLVKTRRVDTRAYELYLRGRFHLNTGTPEGMEKALAYLQQAVALDPSEPLLHAGLALGYSVIGHERMPGAFVKAVAAAERATELGETLAETQLAIGQIKLYYDWDMEATRSALESALTLGPSLAEAHYHYSWYLRAVGRTDAAKAEMRRAIELDPFAPLFPLSQGWMDWFAGQQDGAIAGARKALALEPGFPLGLTLEGYGHLAKNEYAEAFAAHQKAASADKDFRWPLGRTYALAGKTAEARRLAADIAKEPTAMNAWGLAGIYAALGDRDAAFRWLETAYELHFSWIPWVGMDPSFAPLRGDPRFLELARRAHVALRMGA